MEDKNTVKKICYACGFQLSVYPYDPESLLPDENVICPSCGIHYGYDDGGAGYVIPDDLAYSDWKFGDENHVKIMKCWREHWVRGGMKWEHDDPISLEEKPIDWNPQTQLMNLPENFR